MMRSRPSAAIAAIPQRLPEPEPGNLLDSLPIAILVIDERDRLRFANAAAEALFRQGRAQISGQTLSQFTAPASPLAALVELARRQNGKLGEHDLALSGPRFRLDHVAVDIAPLGEPESWLVLLFKDRALERHLARQAESVSAARSAEGLAAMLAHEVKNPLSGIRGAAQLLESRLTAGDRDLARLIREEADRIVDLVNNLEIFTDRPLAPLGMTNIHEVLDHVRRVALAGFARHIRFVEDYDPSLPAVPGSRDALIQVFLNLVKNAAEACPLSGGIIRLATQYRPGIGFGERRQAGRRRLNMAAIVEDNGPGIPAHLQADLFKPFVSGREGGKGLGLAVAAKLVADLDGSIDLETRPGRTAFAVLLPLAEEGTEEGR